MTIENGMTGVTVEREKLLAAIRQNRDQHKLAYDNAMDGFREAATKELGEQLALAKEGKPFLTRLKSVEPRSYLRDYDRVIRMLEMSVSDTIYIQQHEFDQYVQDEWSWKEQFVSSTQSYAKSERR